MELKPISIYGSPYLPKVTLVLLLNQIYAQNPVYNGVLCYGKIYQTIQAESA
jgi:hypothetical protein